MKSFSLLFFLSIFMYGCATTHISREDAINNIPPTKKFSEFNRFFIKPLYINHELKSEYSNEEAYNIINSLLFNELSNVFSNIDQYSLCDASKPDKTLIIEPSIEKIKSIGKLRRVFTGYFSGSSAVVLKTKYIDAKSNEIIAEPSFYQHANAWAAAYKPSKDKSMLYRITKIAAEYAYENY